MANGNERRTIVRLVAEAQRGRLSFERTVNITVIIPKALQAACEGRAKIELGVPPSSDLADVIQTLMTLYPGLRAFVANEKRPMRQSFGVAQAGRKVFLFTSSGSPATT